MTREQQTQVRQMSERLVGQLHHSGKGAEFDAADLVAMLEISRQLSLLTEQVVRLNKKVDRFTNPHGADEWGNPGEK